MNPLNAMIETASDTMAVSSVYNELFEKDGLVVVPAVAVRGGAVGETGDSGEAEDAPINGAVRTTFG